MIVGFLGDIHEDIANLDRALDILMQRGCETIVCLGDIVGFALPFHQYIQTRNGEACVNRIRERCTLAVPGNHDLYAVRKIPLHTAGFDYGPDWYGLDYAFREKKARNRIWLYEDNELPSALSGESMDYLRSLEEIGRLHVDGFSCLVSHFCYPDVTGSAIYFPSQPFHLKKHFQIMRERECRIGISGHGHPEGCLIVDEDSFTLYPFGTHKLGEDPLWIVAPCVARTSRANGCMVLDTLQREIHVLPLSDVGRRP